MEYEVFVVIEGNGGDVFLYPTLAEAIAHVGAIIQRAALDYALDGLPRTVEVNVAPVAR